MLYHQRYCEHTVCGNSQILYNNTEYKFHQLHLKYNYVYSINEPPKIGHLSLKKSVASSHKEMVIHVHVITINT